jgi:hypothetical protein
MLLRNVGELMRTTWYHFPEDNTLRRGGGHAVTELVEALCYKPVGRGLDP